MTASRHPGRPELECPATHQIPDRDKARLIQTSDRSLISSTARVTPSPSKAHPMVDRADSSEPVQDVPQR